MLDLFALAKEAEQLAKPLCDSGQHQWSGVGGRGCPHPEDIGCGRCSQAVYVCDVCGETDYGDPGGPGHADCMSCHFKQHADDLSFWSAPTNEHKEQ